jgi:hypothetical protein
MHNILLLVGSGAFFQYGIASPILTIHRRLLRHDCQVAVLLFFIPLLGHGNTRVIHINIITCPNQRSGLSRCQNRRTNFTQGPPLFPLFSDAYQFKNVAFCPLLDVVRPILSLTSLPIEPPELSPAK